jgi:hypothetical protein
MNNPEEFAEITDKVGAAINGHSSGMIALSLCTIPAMVVKDAGIPPSQVIETLIGMTDGGKDETTQH